MEEMHIKRSRRWHRSRCHSLATMVFIIAFATCVTNPRNAEGQDRGPRVWRDSTGNFSVTATLMRKDESTVTLLTSDGREVSVSLDRLSVRDRRYLSAAEAGPAKNASPASTSKAISEALAGPALRSAEIELIDLPELLQIPVFIETRRLQEARAFNIF